MKSIVTGHLRRESLGISRTIGIIYLIVFGLLGIFALPMIRNPLLEWLRSTYPSIAWKSDPYPLVHLFLCPLAIVAAIGTIRRCTWANWLGAIVLAVEVPFAASTAAHSMYDQYVASDINTVLNERVPLASFLSSASFSAFFVILLSPWRRFSTSVVQHDSGTKIRKAHRLERWLLLITVVFFAVGAYLGYCDRRATTTENENFGLSGKYNALQNSVPQSEAIIWNVSWMDRTNKKEKSIRPGLMDPVTRPLFYDTEKRLLGENLAPPIFTAGDIFVIRFIIQGNAGAAVRLEVINNDTQEVIEVLMDEIVPVPKEHGGGIGYLKGWYVESGVHPRTVSIRLGVGSAIKEQILYYVKDREDVKSLLKEAWDKISSETQR